MIDNHVLEPFVIVLAATVCALGALAAYWRTRARQLKRQVTVMSAELADVRDAHAAAVRAINLAILENVRMRRQRPLVLNGQLYCAYRILPEEIYPN
jgi:hypothetical protein